MLARMTSRSVKRAVGIVAAGIALTVLTSAASAAPECKQLKGKFTLAPIAAPDCLSTVGLCANGSYTGSLNGSSLFIGSSLIPTVDTPTTSVVLLTGDNTIQTGNGTLLTKDAIVLRTTGAGEFAEVDTIVGGTGEWAGASGQIIGSGTFTAAGGEGEYHGEVCWS
ncbi:MAG TPA: hypothetical protein VFU22_30725 [Roseiflexaceae bacterium]|nr:hypothetical protein [Roseiflexaceae bacterium]